MRIVDEKFTLALDCFNSAHQIPVFSLPALRMVGTVTLFFLQERKTELTDCECMPLTVEHKLPPPPFLVAYVHSHEDFEQGESCNYAPSLLLSTGISSLSTPKLFTETREQPICG